MKTLLWNLVLALVWVFATGRFTALNLAFGYVLALAVLAVSATGPRRWQYVHRVGQFAGFVLFFVKEIVTSALRVAHDVVTWRHDMHPAVIGVPLEARTDAEITLLAMLISLTPGSLTLDVSEDRKTLFVHVMYARDVDAARAHIKRGFERRVLEVMR